MPKNLIKQIYADFESGDSDAVLNNFDDSFTFLFNADERYSKYSGAAVGKPGFIERVSSLQEDFVYLEFKHIDMIAEGDRVAARHEMRMKHRATGVEFVLKVADFWTVRDGKAVELVEFYDTALLKNLL